MTTGIALYRGPGLWETILGPGRRSTPPPPFNRNDLVLGVDRPSVLTTGVLPDRPRPNAIYPNDGVGRYYNMSPGQVLTDFNAYCGLRPVLGCRASNGAVLGWTVANPSPSTQYGLIDLTSGNVDDFIGEDLSLVPANPSPAFTGVRGAGGLFRRAHIARVQDGHMSYALNGADIALEFDQSLLERPLITNPDPTRTDGDSTHADVGGQPEGASTIMRGCYVIAWDPAVDGPISVAQQNGGGVAALQITGNRASAGDRLKDVIFDKGWLRGGDIPVFITPTLSRLPSRGTKITNSKISLGMKTYGTQLRRYHLIRPSAMTDLDLTGTVGYDFDTETVTGALAIANA